MAEFGIVTAKGSKRVSNVASELSTLPEDARAPFQTLFDHLEDAQRKIERMSDEIEEVHLRGEVTC